MEIFTEECNQSFQSIPTMIKQTLFLLLVALVAPFICRAELDSNNILDRYNFIYTGQSKNNRIFTIKNGQVISTLNLNNLKGEISDAILLNDGNFLLAHQHGVTEISSDGKIIWTYNAPQGTEIHTAQPIGESMIVFVQNGHPAKCVVMEIPSTKIISEFEVPVAENASVHGQFRNARLTSRGTLLVTNMGLNCVSEFNSEGKEIDRWDTPAPWSATEVGKGNIMVVGRKGYVREFNRRGETIREYDTKEMGATSPQKAVLLRNGNIIVNSWYNEWNKTPLDTANAPLQAVEFDKDGNVVATLRSWKEPELGPSTTIQLLDQPVNRNRMFFGKYNPRYPKLFVEPNTPLGISQGDFPGRVAWVHASGVADWDGRTGLWVEDRWNNQALADKMIQETVMTLTDKPDAKKGWKALFTNFNKKNGKGNRSYKPGQKIAIKLNMNNAITHHDTIELNSSPFVTLALVRSLVKDGGVRQNDIIVCEPSRAITDSIYNKIHREFPEVVFIDNIGGNGRQKCEYYPDMITYSVDNGKMATGLAKCIVDADYLINSALLKTHSGPGVTLTAKNWYGATDIALLWRQNAHNNISQDKRHGKPGYKTFVDFIAHPHLGQKCMLFLIDGTYGSRDVNGAPAPKWQKEPFNGEWACSIIASQDALAADAVAMDMIIGEWPEFESLNYCDEYLREAALIPNAPSGTVYKRDGKPITVPLGIMEHWNNPTDRKYDSINLIYRDINK